jgi:oligopeptidase A
MTLKASIHAGSRGFSGTTTYRQAIMKPGSSRPALELFKAFRGREPSLDALLRHQGMVAG